MANPKNEASLAELKQRFTETDSLVLTEYRGLTTETKTGLEGKSQKSAIDKRYCKVKFHLHDLPNPYSFKETHVWQCCKTRKRRAQK